MIHLAPSEADLHAYVDGQLAAPARVEIERWLAAHPERAAMVAEWKRDAEHLRASQALPGPWPDNPMLEPAYLRRRVHARRQLRLGIAASLLLALGLGTGVGWQAKNMQLASRWRPMADAVSAYRLFAVSGQTGNRLDVTEQAQLQDWLNRHFGALGTLPDLQAHGFKLIGGQRLSTNEGAAAILVYEDTQGGRIGVYLRPAGWFRKPGQRRDGTLLAQYWSRGNVSFAVVGPVDDRHARNVASMLEPRG